MGADVTVFDISASIQRYAVERAESAEVAIKYQVGDFIELASQQDRAFDQVVMELGVVHYFNDLGDFTRALAKLLRPKGRLILNEFIRC